MNIYNDTFTSDYQKDFEEHVSVLLTLKLGGKIPTIPLRNHLIECLTSAYIEATGRRPETTELYRLSNWILMEELTNPHPDKVTMEEYPILTNRQLKKRKNREVSNE